MKIDLHFTATSVEELKEQLKQAYEQLNGPVVETPKKESTKTEYQIELATKTKAAMAEKKTNLKKYFYLSLKIHFHKFFSFQLWK